MNWKNRLYGAAFCLVMGTLYAFSLSCSGLAATILEFSHLRLLVLCALFCLLFYLAFFNRYTFFTALGATLVLGLLLYLSLRMKGFENGWFVGVRTYGEELLEFINFSRPQEQRYSDTLTALLAASMAFVAVLNIHVYFNFYTLTLFGLVVVSVPVLMDWGESEIGLLLFVLCFLVFLMKRLNLNALGRKGAARSGHRMALLAVPLCLGLMGLSALLPYPDLSLDGDGFREYFVNRTENLVYDMNFTGTVDLSAEEIELGGPNQVDQSFVMEVAAAERVYLSGYARDLYTGRSWRVSREDHQILQGEGSYDVRAYGQELLDLQEYYMRYYAVSPSQLTVSTGENRTRTLFTPPFSSSLWLEGDQQVRMNNLGSLSTRSLLDRDAIYTLEYTAWNFDNYYIAAVLQGAGGAGEEMADFLQVPEELPVRVRELAAELTAGAGNNYDRVKALEGYLASSFPYTLNPVPLPEGEDFVDHFLFTGQEGYCTYYATALAVMARCVGVPTRYVEGYVMPRDRNANGNFTVTNAQAHAWVEAWFPGFGWVPFEATSPYFANRYQGEPLPDMEELLAVDPQPQPEVDPEEEPEPQSPEPEPEPEEPELQQPDPGPQEPQTPLPEPEEESRDTGRIPTFVLVLAGALLLAAGLTGGARYLVYRYRLRLRKIDSLPNREAATAYFSYLLRAARACGYPIQPGETALAYAQRVEEELTFSRPVTMGELAEIFCRAAFSANGVSDEERNHMKRCYRDLLRELRGTGLSRPRFFINRYVLMKY